MVHAGLPPHWDLPQAQAYANELEAVLQNFNYEDFFRHMDDGKPFRWRDELEGWPRLRFIANCFTQMRWCDRKGRLDLSGERRSLSGRKRSMPWFEVPDRATRKQRILFGHWAALDKKARKHPRIYALDTGCANGGQFTAFRLENKKYYRVRCRNKAVPWSSGSREEVNT